MSLVTHHRQNISLSKLDCLNVQGGKSYSLDKKYRWYFQKGHIDIGKEKQANKQQQVSAATEDSRKESVLGMTIFTANCRSWESVHPWDQRLGIFSTLSSKSGTNSLNIFPELEMVGISTLFGKKSAPANSVVYHTIPTSHSMWKHTKFTRITFPHIWLSPSEITPSWGTASQATWGLAEPSPIPLL